MDYGFHAPTVSFPVPGTMMIEPTESEPKAELDRFCDALIAIRKEIQAVVDGKADAKDNVLKNAPHTADEVTADDVDASVLARAGRVSAAVRARRTSSGRRSPRIDNPYGDRNLICACPPIEAYVPEERMHQALVSRAQSRVRARDERRASVPAPVCWYPSSSFFVTGPGGLCRRRGRRLATTGLSSRVVHVMNISSAVSRSSGRRTSSRTSIPSSRPSSNMNARVTPSSRPAADAASAPRRRAP